MQPFPPCAPNGHLYRQSESDVIGQTSFGRVEAPTGRVVRPWDVLDVHRACCSFMGRVGAFWASIGRVIRPWDGLGRPRGALFVHGTGWGVHEAHCSSIGRFERPYGTVSSWWHHTLPCSDEVALAAQRCLNAAQYPLSPPRQIRSLHFDRHVSRRHSAIFPFPLGKSVETGTICTQRSI